MNEQEIRNNIKQILLPFKTRSTRVSGISSNPILLNYIDNICTTIFKNNKKAAIYAIMNDIYEWPKCPICGKDVTFTCKSFNRACSNSCSQKMTDFAAKHAKKRATCLAKYGVDSFSKTKEFNIKYKTTCLDRYGTTNYLALSSTREQIKQTCVEKYGVPYHPQDESAKIKRKETMQTRYGVNSPFELQSSLDKQKNWRVTESYENILQLNDECEPLFTKEELYEKGPHYEFQWRCKKCGYVFTRMARVPNNGYHKVRCEKCSPNSMIQKELQDFITSVAPDTIFNSRNIISPKELDIYIPSHNLAIEFNGAFFHNTYHVEKDYHINKTNQCKELGIKLIHIWDCDYVQKPQIIHDRIKSALGIYDMAVYARQCTVKEIDYAKASKFITKYHIQGDDKSKIYLGLFNDNELVSVMSFKAPRFTDEYQWELVRFVNKAGYHVIGGAGKLLKYFEKTYNPKSIITYADKCWSTGNLYAKLGFTHTYDTELGYFYSKNNVKYSRYQCQKHKLKDILKENFDPNKSETENMLDNKFSKVYDCGHMVFVKQYE